MLFRRCRRSLGLFIMRAVPPKLCGQRSLCRAPKATLHNPVHSSQTLFTDTYDMTIERSTTKSSEHGVFLCRRFLKNATLGQTLCAITLSQPKSLHFTFHDKGSNLANACLNALHSCFSSSSDRAQTFQSAL